MKNYHFLFILVQAVANYLLKIYLELDLNRSSGFLDKARSNKSAYKF